MIVHTTQVALTYQAQDYRDHLTGEVSPQLVLSIHNAYHGKVANIIRTYVNNIQIYSDGSGYKGNIRALATIHKMNQSFYDKLGKEMSHIVFKGELVGILLALHLLDKHCKGCNILIFVRNF